MTFGPFPPTPLGLALNLATEQARDREEQERREYEQEHTRRAPERPQRPERPAEPEKFLTAERGYGRRRR